ncbi:transposase [Alteromonas aestuariivivens]|uniref:Transposase n=1 Tax=Alteromonas aestuariivivens TaxID=1938339 RepID=A0A3D8M455_9ALTE|nr:transposase [Alteromonas aestuariivivens]
MKGYPRFLKNEYASTGRHINLSPMELWMKNDSDQQLALSLFATSTSLRTAMICDSVKRDFFIVVSCVNHCRKLQLNLPQFRGIGHGHWVARFLTELMSQRKRPASIVCDNGTEFTSKAMFFWSKEWQVKLNFIQPGKPIQDAFVESFNGKFRDACLNQYWFSSLYEAREEIHLWRDHYNHVRPQSSLNYSPPANTQGCLT